MLIHVHLGYLALNLSNELKPLGKDQRKNVTSKERRAVAAEME